MRNCVSGARRTDKVYPETPTGYKNGDFFPPFQHSFHTSKVVFGYQKCRYLKKDPSGIGIFSKCPLTVCVWADKNVGYDDDIIQLMPSKSLCISLVWALSYGRAKTIRIRLVQRRNGVNVSVLKKYPDTWGRGLKRFHLVVVLHIFPFIYQSYNFLLSVKHSSKIFHKI